MVRRTVNFRELDVDGSRSLGDVVEIPGKAQVIATDPDGKTVVLTREQAKKVKTGDYGNYIINQEPVKRGSVKTEYLFRDLTLMKKHFFGTFPGFDPEMIICGPEDDPLWLEFNNFPLPETSVVDNENIPWKNETERIIVVIAEYPHVGPYGVHIHKSSQNLFLIEKQLGGGHIFKRPMANDSYANSVSGLESKGYVWICFHYAAGIWKFNRNAIGEGDCLAKYIENLYQALGGANYE
jgi:hypothetical protein